MKIKPIYIYGILIITAAVFLIVFTRNNKTSDSTDIIEKEMPKDDIHKQFNEPNKSNVPESVRQQGETLKRSVEENPNDTLKIREYADFLTASHQGDEAIKYYEKILKKDPKRPDIYFAMTFIYFNKKDHQKAEELTKKVLEFDPGNLQAQFNLGAIAATKGEKEKAKVIWSKFIKEHPNTELAKTAQDYLNRL